nr:unnamed protein product [Spirometra erinaceieuropaei]
MFLQLLGLLFVSPLDCAYGNGGKQIPRNLTASALNSTAIRVTWNKPSPASKFGDRYLLEIYNETYDMSYQVRRTEETITGLTPSSIYNITVQAFLTNGTLVRATAFTSVQTLACEAHIPGNFTAWAVNSTSIRVAWQKPCPSRELGKYYLLTVCNHTYERTHKLTKRKDIFTDLKVSSVYNFTVQAVLKNGTPVYPAAFTSAQTLSPEGQMPSNLTASAVNSTAIRVTWNKPSPASKFEDRYLLEIYNETYDRSYQVRRTEETITGLTPSSIYNITVQAFLTNGTLVRATAFTSVQTLACEGQMPSNLTASALNSTAIRMTWNKPSPASKFEDRYLLEIYNETYDRSYQVRRTEETITGLTPSSIYNITVQAFLTNGTLVRATAFTSVQTLACENETMVMPRGLKAEGQMPSNLTASALNPTAIRVTWNKHSPASKFEDRYLLEIYNETYDRSYQVRRTEETITGLTPSSIYNITVQAFLTNGTLVRATAFTSVQNLACVSGRQMNGQPRALRWHKLPDLQEQRSSLAAVCLPGDSRIFVFGGGNNSLKLASVEFCNLGGDWREKLTTADFWLPAAPMRTARWGLAATHFKGTILVAGGRDSRGNTVNVVEMFTPPDARCPLGQWTELAGMPEPRSWFTLLAFANAIFALGSSRRGNNTVEALAAPAASSDYENDLKSWIWSSKNPVETLKWIHGAASIHI